MIEIPDAAWDAAAKHGGLSEDQQAMAKQMFGKIGMFDMNTAIDMGVQHAGLSDEHADMLR